MKALPLLRELKKHGWQAYFVGGAVRDAQMNRDVGDIDIATDASPEEIEPQSPATRGETAQILYNILYATDIIPY